VPDPDPSFFIADLDLIKFTEIASSAPLPFGSTPELFIKVIFLPIFVSLHLESTNCKQQQSWENLNPKI
jgi:hypothetical protein